MVPCWSTSFNPQDDKLQVAVRGPRLRNFSAGSLQLRSACGQRLDLGVPRIPGIPGVPMVFPDWYLPDWYRLIICDYIWLCIYIYRYPNISKPWGWVIRLEYDDSWEIQCHVEPLDPWTMVMVVWNARNTSWGIRSSWCQTGSWGWSTTGPAWGDENSNDSTKWWGCDAMGCGWYLRLPSHTYQYITSKNGSRACQRERSPWSRTHLGSVGSHH